MSSYDKLLGALAVANSQKNLAGDLKDYNDILVHHLDKVYSHESLLKNKFLGGQPQEEVFSPLVQNELDEIVKNIKLYEVQDNVQAARKKWIYKSIYEIFARFTK